MKEQSNSESNGQINLLINQSDIFVVGIGASAGGYEAIEKFFSNMPPDSGMTFVVVQHLSPDFKSLMVELLSKHTEMKVFRVEDGIEIQANCVYLIPPKKTMNIFQNKLFLSELRLSHGLNLPINIFFRSLAEDRQDHSIGIIFSGTGTDGTLGIRDIKGVGGLTIAQDIISSKFDGMPKSAIATGMVDYILSPEKMPEVLIQYVSHRKGSKKDADEIFAGKNVDNISLILMILKKKENIDFTNYKPTTIFRRLEKRMGINQISKLDEYAEHLKKTPGESKVLVNELLIGVTKFFREKEAFDELYYQILPHLFKDKKEHDTIRVWVVACSTGEEAYSIAILFHEFMVENKKYDVDVKIFATDLDKDAVEQASIGCYPDSIIADVSTDRLKKYFTKRNNSFQVDEKIRKMIIFASQDVIKDPPFNNIDLISCRNLLIYFQPKIQKKVLASFHFSLTENGYLFLGKSETVGEMASQYKMLDGKMKIYRKVESMLVPSRNPEDLAGSYTGDLPRFIANRPKITERGHKKFEAIYHEVMSHFEPNAILINDKNEPEYFMGSVDRFLVFSKGKLNLNVAKIVHDDLSVAVGTAVHKCRKDRKEIIYKGISIHREKDIIVVDLKIRPVFVQKGYTGYVIVEINEKKSIDNPEEIGEHFDARKNRDQRIKDLELDLQLTRENLQATVEELETSNEELQATNEELLASNEELQSTNEELQSVNEELVTVNSEYQTKIQELIDLNNDYDNLLNAANAGTLFLDRELNIRKFTPLLRKQVNVVERDIGRPVKHFTFNFKYDNFLEDLSHCLHTGQSMEKEVISQEGQWYLVQINQYKTNDNFVDGLVISFLDISQAKKMVGKVKSFAQAVNFINEMVMVTDTEGKVEFVNNKFVACTGYDLKEIAGRDASILNSGQHEEAFFNALWKNLREKGEWKGGLINRKKNGELFKEKANIFLIQEEGDDPGYYVKISSLLGQDIGK